MGAAHCLYKNTDCCDVLLLLTCDSSLRVSVHVTFGLHFVISQLSLCLKFADQIVGAFPHQSRRVPVGASQTVPQCEVLAVVVVEEEVVVGVVSGAIDCAGQGSGDAVVAVVDRDGPDVDKHIEGQVEHLVEREQEGVDVVRQPLHEAVHWVKGVACKGSGDLP